MPRLMSNGGAMNYPIRGDEIDTTLTMERATSENKAVLSKGDHSSTVNVRRRA